MPFKLSDIQQRVKQRLLSFEPILWASLATHAGALRPRQRPTKQPTNVALQSTAEWQRAQHEVERLGLRPHADGPKNWDALIALDLILRSKPQTAAVLDAGSEVYSPLLTWLYWYGFRDLHGINLVFKRRFMLGPIRYIPGDITRSPYEDARFDVIASLSVLEHGVDARAFLTESYRTLRVGGLLIVSCDYYAERTETAGHTAYGAPVHVFDRTEAEQLVKLAGAIGFEPISPLVLDCTERPVHWKRVGIDFTFLLLAFRKSTKR